MKNIKKILAVILAVLMVAAIPMTAFAAPNTGTPIGTEREQENFVMERINRYLEEEEPFWDYGEDRLYTDENGTTWAYWPGEKKNWIISNENPEWMYRVLDDGTLYVAQYGECEENIVIPSQLDGKTVTVIAYAGNDNTLSITVPDTVKDIDYMAFRNEPKLKRVVIGTGVEAIESTAFNLTDNVELYYCGTEAQWNEIVVWNARNTLEPATWAVTGFDWLANPYEGRNNASSVKAVHFNVNPDELEPLVEEEEPVEPTLFEKLVSGITGIIATITGFFKGIFDFFGSIF